MAFDKNNLFFLPVRASVTEMEEATTDNVRAAILQAVEMAKAGQEKAGAADPIGPNGHPRMLQLSSFICHAGQRNENDRGFTLEDLQERVDAGMWSAPFFGMIDYNHDFSLYGVWYKAEIAFDPKAQAYGILAHGVLFAWRYNELADKMLAMQARQGFIDVSMACLAGWYEPAKDAEGREYLLVRKPVFFTTSVLDVPPADKTARAVGSEDPASSPEKRAAELLRANLGDGVTNPEEATMKVENTEVQGEPVVETAAENKEGVEVQGEEVKGEVVAGEGQEIASEEKPVEEPVVEAPVETASETVEGEKVEVSEEDLAETVASLNVELASANTARQTAEVALTALRTEHETLLAEVAELRTFKSGIEQERAERAAAAQREARMAELPEAIRAEMEKEENKALLDEWMTMSEDKWNAAKKVFSVASVGRKTLADRSAEEGTLSGTADTTEGGWAITRHRGTARRTR